MVKTGYIVGMWGGMNLQYVRDRRVMGNMCGIEGSWAICGIKGSWAICGMEGSWAICGG